MKFLRLAFYVLIAQLVLSGCAGEGVEETSSSSSSEITFDAYVGRNASTRLGINDLDSLQSNNRWNSGFGVFARYNNIHLMDDEHVFWQGDHWGYEHTRYWPSEGSVDFYAFAPWIPGITLDNKLESNEANILFTSNLSPVDLLWAYQPDKTAPISPADSRKVRFQFQHATARLGLEIKANQDLEKNGAVITVEEVNLYGKDDYKGVFDMWGYLNLINGKWNVLKNEDTRWYYAWTPTGTVGKDDDKGNGNDGKYDPTKGTVLKLSASQLDDKTPSITNDKDSYIFIIPQTKNEPFYLKITYTVKQGDLVEKVMVKKNLLDVLCKPGDPNQSFTFVGGKAYVFHLILSLDPIGFSVTVDGKKRDEVTGEITI